MKAAPRKLAKIHYSGGWLRSDQVSEKKKLVTIKKMKERFIHNLSKTKEWKMTALRMEKGLRFRLLG